LGPTTTSVLPPRLADAGLDRRWLRGERGALEEAHRRYRSRLEAVAYRIVGNRADAEEVVQRVFLALPHAAYRGTASLWSYLYRAAVNGSVNLLRSRRRRDGLEREVLAQALLVGERGADPEAQVLEGEILAAVAKALLRVRAQHRRILVLRIVHGLSNVEIAARESLPPATVATWLRRGREELRVALRPLLRDLGRGGA
jgi:RNA polymerase sigma-70 factor (ECF subfamily)